MSITQTCRTLIVEEYDNDPDGKAPTDLATLLRSYDSNTSSLDEIHEQLEKLVVHSFDEFLEKFCPTVYEVCYATDQGFAFSYSTRRGDVQAQHVTSYKLTKHDYYEMLESIYTSRRDVGQPNLLIDDSKLLSLLTPRSVAEKIRDVRRDMKNAYKRYNELKERGENANEYARKIVDYRKEILKQAKYPIHLLPIAIEDAKTKIKLREKHIADVSSSKQDKNSPVQEQRGILDFDCEGWLQISAAPVSGSSSSDSKAIVACSDNSGVEKLPANISNKSVPVPVPVENQIQTRIAEDIKNIPNEFVRDLIVKSYAPIEKQEIMLQNQSVEDIQRECEQIKKQKANYEKVYADAQNEFIRVMSKLIEKLLGVLSFFDHATVIGGRKGRFSEGVMISNCSAGKLVESKCKDQFCELMKTLASEPGKYGLWFAVLPAVCASELGCNGESEGEIDPDTVIDIDADISEDNLQKNSKNSLEDTDWGTAKTFLSVMNEAKIMTIFNFKGTQKDSFSSLSKQRLQEYRELVENLPYGEHAVLAYPNFTLLRERSISLDEDKGSQSIKYQGVYIAAAYPAAGLLVASQQIEVLKAKKLKVDPENLCVHVKLEDRSVVKAFQTKFNRPNIYNMGEEFRKEIGKDMFGFSFCSDTMTIEGQQLNNVYVRTARTLSKGKKTYRPIYQIMTRNYIQRFLKQEAKNVDELQKTIKDKIENKWIQQAKGSPDIVNLVMDQGDKVSYEDGRVKIQFVQDDEDYDIQVELT